MKVQKIIEIIMEDTNTTKAELGRSVGISDEGKPGRATDLIAKRIKQKNISINVLSEMLNVMDYTIAIVPKDRVFESDEYEVTIIDE